MKKCTAVAMVFAACVSATSAEPFRGTIEQVIEQMSDFSADNQTFQVLSKKPLHIRLSPMLVATESPEGTKTELLRAVSYGVYRTFIHTNAESVQVTSQPMQLTIGAQGSKLSLQKTPHATVTVSRSKALEVAKQTLQVESFAELIDARGVWSEKMQNGRYVKRSPGLNKLAADLGVAYHQ